MSGRQQRILHCWADAPDGHATCMLLADHDGPHEWTPDADIGVSFSAPPSEEPVAWALRFKPTGRLLRLGWLARRREELDYACAVHNEGTDDNPYEIVPLYTTPPAAEGEDTKGCRSCRWARPVEQWWNHDDTLPDDEKHPAQLRQERYPLRCELAEMRGGEATHPGRLCVTIDGSDYRGELYVTPEFWCVQWEALDAARATEEG